MAKTVGGSASARVGTVVERVFAATERLLGRVRAAELTVADILSEAQISRRTFYTHFRSKDQVIVALVERTMREMPAIAQPFLARAPDESRRDALRRSIGLAIKLWSEHRFVLRAVAEQWRDMAEIRESWLAVIERFTTAISAEIDAERAAGQAPPGPDSSQLAAMLLWSTSHTIYIAGLNVDADLPDESSLLDAFTTLWIGTIYGSLPT